MVSGRGFTAAVALGGLAVLSFTLAGCGGGGGGGGGGTPPAAATEIQLSRTLSESEFRSTITNPAAVHRVEIKILTPIIPGALKAREVEIQEQAEVNDEEEVAGRITQITPASSTLDLDFGLTITYSDLTSFRDVRSSSSDNGDIGPAEFESRVQAALDNEENPPVKAERNPPAPPQAPDNGSFVATELKLVDDIKETKIEINVDGDNLVGSTLEVLGLSIDISGAVLEQEIEDEDLPGVEEFEGPVGTVNVAGRTFTLIGGTVVHVANDGLVDPMGDLFTLQAVANALAVVPPKPVRAEGHATVGAGGVREALEVKFEVDEGP